MNVKFHSFISRPGVGGPGGDSLEKVFGVISFWKTGSSWSCSINLKIRRLLPSANTRLAQIGGQPAAGGPALSWTWLVNSFRQNHCETTNQIQKEFIPCICANLFWTWFSIPMKNIWNYLLCKKGPGANYAKKWKKSNFDAFWINFFEKWIQKNMQFVGQKNLLSKKNLQKKCQKSTKHLVLGQIWSEIKKNLIK